MIHTVGCVFNTLYAGFFLFFQFPIALRNEQFCWERESKTTKISIKLKINKIVRCATIYLQSNQFNQFQSGPVFRRSLLATYTQYMLLCTQSNRERILISIDFVQADFVYVQNRITKSINRKWGPILIRMNVNEFIGNLHFPVKLYHQ